MPPRIPPENRRSSSGLPPENEDSSSGGESTGSAGITFSQHFNEQVSTTDGNVVIGSWMVPAQADESLALSLLAYAIQGSGTPADEANIRLYSMTDDLDTVVFGEEVPEGAEELLMVECPAASNGSARTGEATIENPNPDAPWLLVVTCIGGTANGKSLPTGITVVTATATIAAA